ncbi:hypothetical protein QEN19_000722 [Hanseniaspora menglaensis]
MILETEDKNIDEDINKLIPGLPIVSTDSLDENTLLEKHSIEKKKTPKRKLRQVVRTLFTAVYLLNIIISIPISFQIGGIDCGLCFTITIFLIYFLLATFKFVFFKEKSPGLYSNWFKIMYYLQLFYIPPLLMICLSLFGKDAGIKEEFNNDTSESDLNILLLSKTLSFIHNLVLNDVWPVYIHVINIWRWLIVHSTPYFTLLEGIFVILFIQTVGQFLKIMTQPYNVVASSNVTVPPSVFVSEETEKNYKEVELRLSTPQLEVVNTSMSIAIGDEEETSDDDDDDLRSIASVQDFNYYNNEKGETVYAHKDEEKSSIYNILGLVASSSLLTISIYYLYKIYILPNFTLNAIEATLIGIFFALAVIIGIYGIVSRKGSILESSLLFAYLVRCIYQINPVLSDSAMRDIMEKLNETWKQQMVGLQNHNLNHNIRNFFSSTHHYTPGDNNRLGAFVNYVLSKLKLYQKSQDRRNIVDLSSVFVTNILPKSIISVYKISTNLIKQSFTPSVATNLTFRLLVYYSATRIIPTLNKRNVDKLNNGFTNAIFGDHHARNTITISPDDHTSKLDKGIDELVKDNMSRTPSIQSLQSYTASPTEFTDLSSPKLDGPEHIMEISGRDECKLDKITELIYIYSPCILIAMYTHLTLQYCKDNSDTTFIDDELCIWGYECIPNVVKIVFNKLNIAEFNTTVNLEDGVWVDNWAFWNWVNILFYLVLYFFELQN